jgi:stage III sporulation protein SpoIIIAA
MSPDASVLLTSLVYVLNQTSGVPALTLCLVQITWEDLKAAEAAVGDFGSDNRAGVQGTLHRISAMRSRKGTVVGLTCRVGRAVTGHVDMIRDILDGKTSSNSLWSF